ncbi:MAG: hypothetical protein U0836_10545 [Pirellulales bacterium]
MVDDDDPAAFDHHPRQLEHRFLVLVRRVDRDVGVEARTEVAFVLQAEYPRRAGGVMIAISLSVYSRVMSASWLPLPHQGVTRLKNVGAIRAVRNKRMICG